jgi:hypothetical protein
MPNFSGVWNLKEQIQAIAAGRWTGLPYCRSCMLGGGVLGRLGDDARHKQVQPCSSWEFNIWQQVSGGGSFSAAVTTSGALFTWGRNTQGQLGLHRCC